MLEDISRRRYSLGDILLGAWAIFKAHAQTILVVTLIIYIPVNIVLSFVPVNELVDEQGLRGFRLYMQLMRLLEGVFGVLVTMSVAFIADRAVRGETTGIGDALRGAFSRWWPVIWTGILARLILIGLLLLLIVPGVVWAVYYAFVVYVVTLRDSSGKRALDYSKALVKGQWWRVLGLTLAIWLLGTISAVVPVVPFYFLPDHPLLGIFSDTIVDLVSSFFIVAHVVFFLNVDRLRATGSAGP
jgi:hypothetical protein